MPYSEPLDFDSFMRKRLAGEDPLAEVSAKPPLVASTEDVQFNEKLPTISDQDGVTMPEVPIEAPKEKLVAASASPGPESNPVKEAIAKKYGYGPGLDNESLRAAQEDANITRRNAGLGQAFNKIAYSIAGIPGKEDNSYYQQMAKGASQPVEDISQLRKASIEGDQYAKYQEGSDPASPMSKRAQAAWEPAIKALGMDASGLSNLSYEDLKHESSPMQIIAKLKTAEKSALGKASAFSFRDEQLDKRNANTTHRSVMKQFDNDSDLQNAMKQYKGLDRAMSIISHAKKVTPQQIQEFQQAVRSALSIRGTGGVDERADTYIKSLGLNAANFGQFLTGEPADIAKNDSLILHLKDLAQTEQQNIADQKNTRVNTLMSGHEDVYDDPRFSHLKDALMNKVGAVQSQFQPTAGRSPKTADGGGRDPKIEKYAADNGLDYQHAEAILRKRGYGG